MAPVVSRTPFCKVCMQAGKSKTEYTSHYTMDKPGPGGVVVCPYLLSLECRYCHEKGHTPKYCPKAKANNERREKAAAYSAAKESLMKTPTRPKPASIPMAPKKQKPANKFACLEDDVDDVREMKEKHVEKKEEFPALQCAPNAPKLRRKSKNTKMTPASASTSWAQIATKADDEVPTKPEKTEEDFERERLEQEHARMMKRLYAQGEAMQEQVFMSNNDRERCLAVGAGLSLNDDDDHSLFEERLSDWGDDTFDYCDESRFNEETYEDYPY